MKFYYLFLATLFFLLTATTKGQDNFKRTDDGKLVVIPAFFGEDEKERSNNFSIFNLILPISNNCGDPNYKPLFGYHFLYDSVTPYSEYRYICDENGILKRMTITYYDKTDSIVSVFNETYRVEGKDLADTSTLYKKENNMYYPMEKRFATYNLFGNQFENAYFIEASIQRKEKNDSTWINSLKSSHHFMDSKSGHIIELSSTYPDQEGELTMKNYFYLDSLVLDESGNVKWRISKINENEESGFRYEYLYHEDGGPFYEMNAYYSSKTGNEWTPDRKIETHANIEWYEWNGFRDNFNIITVLGESEANEWYYNTMTKISSYDIYSHDPEDSVWKKIQKKKFAWNVDGTKTHIDSLFGYDEKGNLYLLNTVHNNYNHCGDYISYVSYIWDNDLEPYIKSYEGIFHDIEYNQYGREKDFIYTLSGQGEEEFATFYMGTRITDFVPVSIADLSPQTGKISLFPNPSQGRILIKSQEAMQSIEIFDMMGRLVEMQIVHNNETTISLNHLPKGLYLIKVLMKSGEKQVEKLLLQ
ncbi:MAG: T9SS type A sorting domain-containing protein [Bacteroidales bacterium]|jgi:hypothetical protein|nr:T9SS type A sorting domain-containing protein [Bacteroidales bacterium]